MQISSVYIWDIKDDSRLDLKVGTSTILEKIVEAFPVCDTIKSSLVLNSRAILTPELKSKILTLSSREVIFYKDNFICAIIEDPILFDVDKINKRSFWEKAGYKILSMDLFYIEYPWDVIKFNSELIIKEKDLFISDNNINFKNIDIIGDKKNFIVGKNLKITGNIVIDVSSGPVIIEDNVEIKYPSIIEGPVFIGRNSLIDGAKIRPGTTIGNNCKIAGEAANSIFHSFSNKHHDGFIGHSYIGSWVNLGAMTTNSDLKNNYHPVKVNYHGEIIHTNELKLGCFIGNYTTLGIGSLIPTGAFISPCCNIFGGGMIDKYYPAFVWHDTASKKHKKYKLDEALGTYEIMYKRRGQEFTQEVRAKLENLFSR